MTPRRVRLRRTKGWRLPPNTVKVARPTVWGNPFRIGLPVDVRLAERWGWKLKYPEHVCQSAIEAVDRFASIVYQQVELHEAIRRQLGGKNLACFCPLDQPCHADALLDLANREPR